jgi:hypothetical protein
MESLLLCFLMLLTDVMLICSSLFLIFLISYSAAPLRSTLEAYAIPDFMPPSYEPGQPGMLLLQSAFLIFIALNVCTVL